MFTGALVVLPGLGGSRAEWASATAALGWPVEIHGELPSTGSVVVVGHSHGAVRALNLAAAHPDRVDALVVSGGFFPPARGGRTVAATIADYVWHRVAYVRDVVRRKRAPQPTRGGARELASLARLGVRQA